MIRRQKSIVEKAIEDKKKEYKERNRENKTFSLFDENKMLKKLNKRKRN